jgi:hypothetical protein
MNKSTKSTGCVQLFTNNRWAEFIRHLATPALERRNRDTNLLGDFFVSRILCEHTRADLKLCTAEPV